MNKLSSRFYLTRISKSKDLSDLSTSLGAYFGFLKFRQAYSIRNYHDSVKRFDFGGMCNSFLVHLN
jgi:hypothetical protein